MLRHDALEKISDYRGEDGLRGALRELGLSRQDVPVNDEGVVLDADTPEEYNRLLLHNLRIGGGQESLRLDLQLHLCALDSVFDPFFAQLLEMVRMTGSLQMACHAVHISDSKGWKLVRRVEAAGGFPGGARVVGGAGALSRWRKRCWPLPRRALNAAWRGICNCNPPSRKKSKSIYPNKSLRPCRCDKAGGF